MNKVTNNENNANQRRDLVEDNNPAGPLFNSGEFAEADIVHVDNAAGHLTDMCGTSARCITYPSS
ncbi:DUF6229 family protein [Xenorhabdus sp. PB62.4]|uniref:DUF6229 family protein n=1 Tax=Xenorhabdus sp. PB62.4 TaxID=1851573 RepID=UPI0016573A12|nr:DUF6229 family protein [Xenorhabdus sp. PB62.4]MBC8955038.1 hypothetical protein [Xenorhabdus sp. PB62.4]